MKIRPDLKWLILIAFLTFLVRVAFFLIYAPDYRYENMEIDSWLQIAERLVGGEGYSWLAPHIPTAKRGPVIVYFFVALLWVFGQQSLPIIMAQWLIEAAIGVVLYLLTLEVFNDRRVALTSSFLFIFYVPEIIYTFRAWSEPLFTLLLAVFMLSLLCTLRLPSIWSFTITGILLGLTILARPSMQFYPLVVIVLIYWTMRSRRDQAVKGIAVLLITLILVLTPWTIRNYLVFGHFIPASTYSGWPLFESNHSLGQPDFLRYRDHRESTKALMEVLEERIDPPTSEPPKIFLYATANGMSEYEVNQIAQEAAIKTIFAYPDRYFILSLVRFLRLWFNISYGSPPSLESCMVLALNLVLLSLAMAAFLFYRGAWVRRATPIAVLIVMNTVIYTASQALVRYNIPIMPYVILFAAFTLVKMKVYQWVMGSRLVLE